VSFTARTACWMMPSSAVGLAAAGVLFRGQAEEEHGGDTHDAASSLHSFSSSSTRGGSAPHGADGLPHSAAMGHESG